jgi:KipI family sensor histidine kinase inhibitor
MRAQSVLGQVFPRFQPIGDSALLVTFGERVDLAVNRQALSLARLLAASPLPGLGEAVPGYATLLVHYDPLLLDYHHLEDLVRQHLSAGEVLALEPRRVEVPVVYGGEAGPDLGFVAGHAGLSEAEVVRIHSGRDYPVFMMGFTPGFPYLGGMDPAIAAPRLATPRTRVPAGSVGIAGEQTGIYPLDSPGGWRIIGRTALSLFDPSREPPFLLAPGDLVRYVPA